MNALVVKPEEAAEALKISRTRVYELMAGGQLRSVKIGRNRRIPVDALTEFPRCSGRNAGMSGRRGHGEGSIYQRPDGRWAGMLDLGWIDGKRRRRMVAGTTRAEVVGKLDELRRAQRQGVNLAAAPRTVGQWLDEWLRDVKAHDGTRASMVARYRSAIETHLKPGLGRIRLDRLTPQDVQAFLGAHAGTVSTGTVLKIHGVLRSALSDAERLDLVARNVAKRVRVPTGGRNERRALTTDEAQRFLEVVAGDRLEGVFVLALTMGLRRGEILGLAVVPRRPRPANAQCDASGPAGRRAVAHGRAKDAPVATPAAHPGAGGRRTRTAARPPGGGSTGRRERVARPQARLRVIDRHAVGAAQRQPALRRAAHEGRALLAPVARPPPRPRDVPPGAGCRRPGRHEDPRSLDDSAHARHLRARSQRAAARGSGCHGWGVRRVTLAAVLAAIAAVVLLLAAPTSVCAGQRWWSLGDLNP